MTTLSQIDWHGFQSFIQPKLVKEHATSTLEEQVAEYRAYQTELAALRRKLAVSAEQTARGEAKVVDAEQNWQRIDSILRSKGIAS